MTHFLLGMITGVLVMVCVAWVLYFFWPTEPDAVDTFIVTHDNKENVSFVEPVSFSAKFEAAESVDDVLQK